MLDALSRAFFHGLASSRALKRLASRYGMRTGRTFARRFIAGETVEEALAVARALEAQGLLNTLDYLGEQVASREAADAAARDYVRVVECIAEAGIARNISIKLTQLGLDADRVTCLDNLRRILEAAGRHEFFVRIDMESSTYTAATLELFEQVWREGHRHVGVVLQSCLHRSEADARRVNALGARIRLVKGAYREPRSIAYQTRAEVDEAFLRLMRLLLAEGTYPAIATHDERLIVATEGFAAERRLGRDRFEFQLLYGVRRDLQRSLARGGYRVRIYVPFGTDWFPYFMRRLGERPANVMFVVRSLIQERG